MLAARKLPQPSPSQAACQRPETEGESANPHGLDADLASCYRLPAVSSLDWQAEVVQPAFYPAYKHLARIRQPTNKQSILLHNQTLARAPSPKSVILPA